MKKLLTTSLSLIMLTCLSLFFLTACNLTDTITDDTSESETETETETSTTFTLTSTAISDGEILEDFKCKEKVNGVEASIPLSWSNVPEGTASLAIIMHHYPANATSESVPNSYLLLWDIDPSVLSMEEGEADDGPWYIGANKDGRDISYTSPCSPSAGTHSYTITVYALSATPTSLPTSSSIDVDYTVLKNAIDTVDTLGTAVLTFDDVTL